MTIKWSSGLRIKKFRRENAKDGWDFDLGVCEDNFTVMREGNSFRVVEK